MTDPRKEPIFLDIEASSLDGIASYPIEIAWGREKGEITSYLINPYGYPDDWTDWDPSAQAVHGLSRYYLSQHGELPETVATIIETALGGRVVYTDEHSFDRFWLRRLFEAIGKDCPLECRPIRELLQQFLPSISFYFDLELNDYTPLETLFEKARERCGLPAHRAANDVACLRMVYTLAQKIAR